MGARRYVLLLGLVVLLSTANLAAQSFGFGLSLFNFLNTGVVYSELQKKDGGEDKSYDFKIPDAQRVVGFMPGVALDIASRQGLIFVSGHIGIISTPNKSYIPPMGARFLLGVRALGRLPLQRESRPRDLDMGFLLGLGGDLTLGGTTSQPSETKVVDFGIDLSLLFGLSMLFQRQFELYFISGPYIGIEGTSYKRTGYDKDFFLVPWGFILPQIGFRLWV